MFHISADKQYYQTRKNEQRSYHDGDGAALFASAFKIRLRNVYFDIACAWQVVRIL